MKTLRILMWVVCMLLVYLIATNQNNNSLENKTTGTETTYTETVNEIDPILTPNINPTSANEEINNVVNYEEAPYIEDVADDRIVACRACVGMGHNPFENPCRVCMGKKFMPESTMLKRYEQWEKQVITCPWCQGTGLSYRARVMTWVDWNIIAPPGYYNCKVCNGKKKGTRAELINNFRINSQIYGPDL